MIEQHYTMITDHYIATSILRTQNFKDFAGFLQNFENIHSQNLSKLIMT